MASALERLLLGGFRTTGAPRSGPGAPPRRLFASSIIKPPFVAPSVCVRPGVLRHQQRTDSAYSYRPSRTRSVVHDRPFAHQTRSFSVSLQQQQQAQQLSKMAARVHRVTSFKIPDPANQNRLLEAYKVLAAEQKKDGKPYILYMCAGVVTDPERAKGFTVVGKTEFASMEDMKFYDFDCPAHQNLKALAGSLGLSEPPHTTFFEATPLLNITN